MWLSQLLRRRVSNGLDQIAEPQRPGGPHRNCLVIPHLIFLPQLLFVHAATAGDALCDNDAEVGVVSAATACGASSKTGVPCSCDVRTLRPLQGAVGMEEVRDKADKIKVRPGKACQKLASDPIKAAREGHCSSPIIITVLMLGGSPSAHSPCARSRTGYPRRVRRSSGRT
jgi:hypothetical protein